MIRKGYFVLIFVMFVVGVSAYTYGAKSDPARIPLVAERTGGGGFVLDNDMVYFVKYLQDLPIHLNGERDVHVISEHEPSHAFRNGGLAVARGSIQE